MSKIALWERHMKAYESSGLSKKEYCKKHKLNFHTFDYWRSNLRKREKKEGFVRVVRSSPGSSRVEIELGDMLIRVPEDFSEASLKTVLEVARARD